MGEAELGAVRELSVAFDPPGAGRAAGRDEALPAAFVGVATADLQLEVGDRAGAAGDPRDLRLDPQPVRALMDARDRRLDDDRGRRRDVDVGVEKEGGDGALDAAVEEDQRTGRAERLLFGEGDLDFGLAGTDDRLAAGAAGARRAARLELGLAADRQAGGVDGDRLVDVDADVFQRWGVAVSRGPAPGRGRSGWLGAGSSSCPDPRRAGGAASSPIRAFGRRRCANVGRAGGSGGRCYSSSRRAISRSASEPRRGRPRSSSIAPMRLRTVRRSTPRAAAVEEMLRSASK